MVRILLSSCWVILFGACCACSSGSAANQSTPQNVISWKCCELGDGCACHEQTPNSATFCSNFVNSCNEIDGGVGCCVAAFMGDGWECDCSANGAACPTPGANCVGDCPTPTNLQSVSSCPP